MNDRIIHAIRGIAKDRRELQAMICTVDSVDEENGTCDVTPSSGAAQLFDVLLQVQDPGVVIIPKVGSLVLVDFYDDAYAFVVLTSTTEALQVNHEGHSMRHDKKGLSVTRQNDSLAKAIGELTSLNADLIDLLTRFIVITPAGPSTNVDPQTITNLQRLKTRLTQIENHFNRLLN